MKLPTEFERVDAGGEEDDDAIDGWGCRDPLCAECGRPDGPEREGRPGWGRFYCGDCWRAWDRLHGGASDDGASEGGDARGSTSPAAAEAEVPEVLEGDFYAGNFFDQYRGDEEGTDDAVGHWDPDLEPQRRDGEMALPVSWERPVCSQCGKDEGDFGGGRYRREGDGYVFYCGRCWMSWDPEAKAEMMSGFAPPCLADNFCPPPEAVIDPFVDCDAPDALLDDDDWGGPADWYEEVEDAPGGWEAADASGDEGARHALEDRAPPGAASSSGEGGAPWAPQPYFDDEVVDCDAPIPSGD